MKFEEKMEESRGSWVYVLGTSSDRERAKIGITKNNPMLRFSILRCADPGLYVSAAFFIPNGFPLSARKIETGIHKSLAPSRVKFHNEGNSEWFWINASHAQQVCREYIENATCAQGEKDIATFTCESYYFDNETALIAYESDLESFYGKPLILDEGELPW